jgi:hypothetical protein
MVLYYRLNDQSGSVLGDSTVLSWAGCHNTQPCFKTVVAGVVDQKGDDK